MKNSKNLAKLLSQTRELNELKNKFGQSQEPKPAL